MFNEGQAATGPTLLQVVLCDEAIRLGRLLAELLPGETSPGAPRMLLHHACRDSWLRSHITICS